MAQKFISTQNVAVTTQEKKEIIGDIKSAFREGIKNKLLKSDKEVVVQKLKNMARTELKVV